MTAVEAALRHIEKLMARAQKAPRATKSVKRTATTSRPEVRSGKPVVSAGRPGRAAGVPAEKKPAATHGRALKREKVGHRPPRSAQPFEPPRTEPDITEALVETFAPAPTPPEVPGPISAPLYVPPLTVEVSAEYDAFRVPDWVDGRSTVRPRPPVDDAPPLQPNVNFSGLTKLRGGGTPIEPASFSPTASSSTTGGSFNVRANCKAVDAKTGLVCKLGVHTGEHGHERGRFRLVAAAPVRRAVDDAAWNTGDSGDSNG